MCASIRIAAIAATAMLAAATAQAAETATADMVDQDGRSVGTVTLTETESGVLIKAALSGLPAGRTLAFHIHEHGVCEAPFTSAGGHFNPEGHEHGFKREAGHHAGDMPNIHVPDSGDITFEVLNPAVTLAEGQPNSLLGGDGTSLMIHEGPDDYRSDPAGDAGARIVCGVIERG